MSKAYKHEEFYIDSAFEEQIAFDDLHELLTVAGLSHTANRWPAFLIYTQATNRLNLINPWLDHFRLTHPWLPDTQAFEDYDETQDDEWSSWMNNLDSSYSQIFGQYLELMRHFYYATEVRSLLAINNTIDQGLIYDSGRWSSLYFVDELYEGSLSQSWNKYITTYTQKRLRLDFGFIKLPAIQDEASKIVTRMTYASRRSEYVQRLFHAVEQAHKRGWYMVFDTISLRNDAVKDFYETPTALRDYFRRIGQLVSSADLRRLSPGTHPHSATAVRSNMADCFQYFCVPEYGTQEGRLHFHALYFIRTLPDGSRDPNLGLSSHYRIRRQLDTLKCLWDYGFNDPRIVRYAGDAYGRLGYLAHVNPKTKKAEPFKPPIAVARYISKYVSKQVNSVLDSKGLNGEERWLTTASQFVMNNRKHFRVRMSRGFGRLEESMSDLSLSSMRELCLISSSVTPKTRLIKSCVRRELKRRLGTLTIAELLAIKPETINLLASLRDLILKNENLNLQSSTVIIAPHLNVMDVSNETLEWLRERHLLTSQQPGIPGSCFAGR